MTSTALASEFAKTLRELFASHISRDQPVALVDFPDNSNCGDHAIWLGEKALLTDIGAQVAYQCSAASYDRGEMAAKLKDGTILVHGGASFGDRHQQSHEFRMRLLSDFPAHKIVVFPHNLASLESSHLDRTAALLAKHPDVIVFAREADSQQILRRSAGKTKVDLAPDVSFMLGSQRRAREPICDIVWVARTDQDRASDQTEAAARLASQPAEKFVLPEFPDGIEVNFVIKQRPPTVLLTDWQSLFFENESARLAFRQLDFDARANVYVSRALYMLSLGHVVITDRLHGHILCLLLGIPHIFLNNRSGKNRSFYDTWTREASLCRFAETPADAWASARAGLAKLKAPGGADAQNWSWQGAGT